MRETDRAVTVPPRSTAERGTATEPQMQEAARVGYSVPRAARALGMSERAVRKRIAAGTLPAERIGRSWSVALSAGALPPPTEPAAPVAVPHAAQDAVPGGTDLAPLAELIARQGDEIRRLAEASTAWQFRAMQAEERLKQLTAGDAGQDAPQTRSEAPGATNAPTVGQGRPPTVVAVLEMKDNGHGTHDHDHHRLRRPTRPRRVSG